MDVKAQVFGTLTGWPICAWCAKMYRPRHGPRLDQTIRPRHWDVAPPDHCAKLGIRGQYKTFPGLCPECNRRPAVCKVCGVQYLANRFAAYAVRENARHGSRKKPHTLRWLCRLCRDQKNPW